MIVIELFFPHQRWGSENPRVEIGVLKAGEISQLLAQSLSYVCMAKQAGINHWSKSSARAYPLIKGPSFLPSFSLITTMTKVPSFSVNIFPNPMDICSRILPSISFTDWDFVCNLVEMLSGSLVPGLSTYLGSEARCGKGKGREGKGREGIFTLPLPFFFLVKVQGIRSQTTYLKYLTYVL